MMKAIWFDYKALIAQTNKHFFSLPNVKSKLPVNQKKFMKYTEKVFEAGGAPPANTLLSLPACVCHST